MKQALTEQPVTVALKAGCGFLKHDITGAFTKDDECACDGPECLDHAVLMVGCDDTHDPPCLLVKNGRGPRWGEDGCFRIAQTKKGDFGLFGILAEGVFPSTNSDCKEPSEPLKFWQVILIVVGGALVLTGIGHGVINPLMRGEKE